MAGDTVFGIDLGTTESCIAFVDDQGREVVVRNAIGEDTTPSVIHFRSRDDVLVGHEAKNMAQLAPDRTFSHVKHQMGTDVAYNVHGRRYGPDELSALIVSALVRAARDATAMTVRDVVVTVPTYFSDAAREATGRACEIVGLTVLDLLAEPVAAALHYMSEYRSPRRRHILVCDLGGATLDTTVLRIDSDDIHVVNADGDHRLGGADWDSRLVDHLFASFVEQHPDLDPSDDDEFLQHLWSTAEDLKKALSRTTSRRLTARFSGAAARIEMTRERFEELTSDLLGRVVDIAERTVASAKSNGVPQVDEILLVGGMAKMPALATALKDRLGLETRLHEPELAVAKGAARYGAVRAAGENPLVPRRFRERERLADVVSDLDTAADALDVSGDVYTIAAVLGAVSTKPPLSLALLGDWGAGKSSFMRQVKERLERLSRSSVRVGERDAYVATIRQVTFNAWHYSDDHLWVGLIEQLFRELRPEDTPDTGRVTELEARLAGEAAERERLEHDLAAVQRADSRRAWSGRLLAPLRSLPVFRAAVRGVWQDVRTGGWRIWAGLLVLVAGAAAVVAGQQIIGIVVGVAGPLVAVGSQVGEYVAAARTRLLARKSELDADIRATTRELDELDPARRLDRLLAELTAEDRYAGFRGLTGRIHHDLRRLSDDLGAAQRRWEADGAEGPPPLQRIVLYVDDLDRCTPERVVDVLQAVNLLLTMDLFMVVVAVDPRWLLRSLSKHHGELLTEPARFGSGAGPVAYLDKIFHIPFALRPMGDKAVAFLHSLLPDFEAEPVPTAVENDRPAPPTDRALSEPAGEQEATPEPRERPTVTTAVAPVVTPFATAERLRVTAGEREFLGRLAPLLATPRAVKKLTNLYRMLRLSIPQRELPGFLNGSHQAAALMLTALVAAPTDVRAVLVALRDAPDGDVVDVLKVIDNELGPRLAALVLDIRKDTPVLTDVAEYRRWASEIARFGFETYDIYVG